MQPREGRGSRRGDQIRAKADRGARSASGRTATSSRAARAERDSRGFFEIVRTLGESDGKPGKTGVGCDPGSEPDAEVRRTLCSDLVDERGSEVGAERRIAEHRLAVLEIEEPVQLIRELRRRHRFVGSRPFELLEGRGRRGDRLLHLSTAFTPLVILGVLVLTATLEALLGALVGHGGDTIYAPAHDPGSVGRRREVPDGAYEASTLAQGPSERCLSDAIQL